MQAFNWESHHQGWYHRLMEQANWFASLGITVVWIPPFTDSVSPQGYMPLDLYNLNSRYGSQDELRRCLPRFPQCMPGRWRCEHHVAKLGRSAGVTFFEYSEPLQSTTTILM